jgi:monothiol glutaredoxin
VDTVELINQTLKDNPIVIFMKGSPEMPQCGFSMQASQALKACKADFAYVDVLANPDVRQTLPSISNWPTFPQIFINGDLVGGCDIVLDLYQSGELQQMVSSVAKS